MQYDDIAEVLLITIARPHQHNSKITFLVFIIYDGCNIWSRRYEHFRAQGGP